MKRLFITSALLFVLVGCQDSSDTRSKIHLMNQQKTGVNPNSLAYRASNAQQDRENKLKLSKIEADTKIEIAKIKSQNQLQIAQVNADVQKNVAKQDATATLEKTKIEALTKKDEIYSSFYITLAVIMFLSIVVYFLYLNNKKNRELKDKLHKEELEHEKLLKEREFNEKRLHKVLELVENGKLSLELEKDVIASIIQPTKSNLIEHKNED